MNNLFIYWIGKEYKLISELRKLIYLHSTNGNGYTVHLLNHENIKDYIEIIPPYFYSLQPAHQADFVRVHVICKYGGIWLDSDTLVLDSLDSLFKIIEEKDGFFIRENNKITWNGIFGSKPNTHIMLKWKDLMMSILNTKKNSISWSEIGSYLIDKICNNNDNDYHIFNGLDNMYPINWPRCVEEFINKPYDNYKNIIRSYQPLIVLVNSVYKSIENNYENLENTPLYYFIQQSYINRNMVIYLKIAKNMGTTMTTVLNKEFKCFTCFFEEDLDDYKIYNSEVLILGHKSTISFFKKRYKLLFNNSNKMIIFREPLDRLISAYNYLKLNKPYSHYLNNVNLGCVRDSKKTYNNHYVHFETTQSDAIDYNEHTYHTNKYFWIKQDDIKKLFILLPKLEGKLMILNNHKHTILPNKSEIDLHKQIYIKDFNIYNKI
jgi:hypothetical protein